ncbi:MAG: hypothetical protein DRG83_04460 [Deltaproteobacteria bacterium]|nr:MAG: hypothetical protein DRG83_04460 [Deltaproteobacteria bacterium]
MGVPATQSEFPLAGAFLLKLRGRTFPPNSPFSKHFDLFIKAVVLEERAERWLGYHTSLRSFFSAVMKKNLLP